MIGLQDGACSGDGRADFARKAQIAQVLRQAWFARCSAG
jgi:hypothetical protein